MAEERILIVDDDEDILLIVQTILANAGYSVTLARTGREGVDLALELKPDLILLDVMMPGMDGFEVCAALRAGGHCIPIILLTARDDMDTRLEGMHQGVSEFLTKPINKHELFARVRAQLHILDLNRQLDTVERNLRGTRAPAAKPSGE